jgi:hypothetical protein
MLTKKETIEERNKESLRKKISKKKERILPVP